jgi:colicin import membrane protein
MTRVTERILGIGRLKMNKNVIIAAIVVLAAAAGYYQFSYAPAQKTAMEAAAVADAAAATAKAAEEATAAAAAEATAAAEKAAADAAAAVTDGAAAVTDGAAAVTDGAAAVVGGAMEAMPALDAATFDPAAVAGMIDGSTLDDAMKATLKAAVTAAGTDPAKITAVIAQVKTALGM